MYITSPGLTYLIVGSLYILTPFIRLWTTHDPLHLHGIKVTCRTCYLLGKIVQLWLKEIKTFLREGASTFELSHHVGTRKESVSHSVVSDSLPHCRLQSTRLLCSWNSPGKNTEDLQGIFPIQWSNPGLLHCRQIPYHLSHQGSPKNKRKISNY